ncbi:Coenzyme F420 hydrogenase/dehydrogenase, beta subunit C-terminal domain [Terrisporobacter glycolicus]|uniref:4Fe-4S ferredoxin-type domain-containing protein n=1 Tax=Terrisporobacter glycolicus ATCC 14880 = DSM 1288 TaxID=1121315 RepID=A0ABZ2ESK0_9FIRM|nr:Coenzyme F420 hydrogenase/dehydrogenase, beta subunit C-terminal domain [Terrisporobacter glycolicus]
MKKICEKEKCCGCHACFNICTKNAISMNYDEDGFLYPIINAKRCVECNLCKNVCPILSSKVSDSLYKIYACYNLDEQVRKLSSSGGIFTLLAKYVIERKGIVFGARFDENLKVIHDEINNENKLNVFRGSKYVQSEIGNTYFRAKLYLEKGILVLFSGTPCQIHGLKSYLEKEYENLICVDLICHGVPSPKIWTSYKDEISNGKRCIDMKFRDKTLGLKDTKIKFYFEDGSVYEEKYNDSKYINGFIQNCFLRLSCYRCDFKGENRKSDITLGDFWGIKDILPNLDDNKGISLIISHSNKAEKILGEIKNSTYIKEVNSQKTFKENPCALRPVELDDKRSKFYAFYSKFSVSKSVKKCTKIPIYKLIKFKLESIKYNTKYILYSILKKINIVK